MNPDVMCCSVCVLTCRGNWAALSVGLPAVGCAPCGLSGAPELLGDPDEGSSAFTDGWFMSTWKSEEILRQLWTSNNDRETKKGSTCNTHQCRNSQMKGDEEEGGWKHLHDFSKGNQWSTVIDNEVRYVSGRSLFILRHTALQVEGQIVTVHQDPLPELLLEGLHFRLDPGEIQFLLRVEDEIDEKFHVCCDQCRGCCVSVMYL